MTQWVSPRPPTPQQVIEWRASPEGQKWLKDHRHPPQKRPVGSVQPFKRATERQYLMAAQASAEVAIEALSRSLGMKGKPPYSIIIDEREAIEEEWVRVVTPMAYYSHTKRVTVEAVKATEADRKADVFYPVEKRFNDKIEFDLFRGKADFSEPKAAAVVSAARCECGASKTGIADYAMGHSSWCPVKE